jgi:hypothetical protein
MLALARARKGRTADSRVGSAIPVQCDLPRKS